MYALDSSRNVLATISDSPLDFTASKFDDCFVSEGAYVTYDNIRYYSVTYSGGYVVLAKSSTELTTSLSYIRSLTYLLSSVEVGDGGYIFAVNKDTGKVLYYPISSLVGDTVTDIGLSDSALNDGYKGWVSLKNEDGTTSQYYCISKQSGDYLFYIAAVPRSALTKNVSEIVICALIMCLFAVTCTLLYIVIVENDLIKHKKEYQVPLGKKHFYASGVEKKAFPITVFGVICVFVLSFYTQSLFIISKQSSASNIDLEQLNTALIDNETSTTTLKASYKTEYLSRCYSVANLISQNESYYLSVDEETHKSQGLLDLTDNLGLKSIYVFGYNKDDEGNEQVKVIATSGDYYDFVLNHSDSTSQSYPFYEVAKGYKDYFVQEATYEEASGNYVQYIGVRRVDKTNKKILGMVQISVDPSVLQAKLAQTKLTYILNKYKIGAYGYFGAVDKETKLVSSFSKEDYVGNLATNYGFTEDSMSDGWSGFLTIDSVKAFCNVKEISGNYVYAIVPSSSLLNGRVQISAITGVICLLMLFVLNFICMFSKTKQVYEYDDPTMSSGKKPEAKTVTYVDRKGKEHKVNNQGIAYRFTMEHVKWDQKTPEMKLGSVFGVIFSIIAIVIAIMLVAGQNSYAEDSIVYYIMANKWEKGFNIFSLIAIVLESIVVFAICTIVRKIIIGFTRSLGSKTETIGRLIDSVIKYGAIIFIIFQALLFVGVDLTTVVTGAGILTLVVGFGAQSLISDILAGIFIVFEGEFRVGDIVTIDGWRGTVIEIGIRTTKVEDSGQDIKIFSNSKISGVINMTKEYSYAVCDIEIDFNESLEKVENCINKALPIMKKNIKGIVDGPYYSGVASITSDGVVIRLVAECEEQNRNSINRGLLRELKIIFDANDITIPHQQITFSSRKDDKVEKATRREKAEAQKFLDEQTKVSKRMQPSGNDSKRK